MRVKDWKFRLQGLARESIRAKKVVNIFSIKEVFVRLTVVSPFISKTSVAVSKASIAFAAILFISACSKDEIPYEDQSVELLYNTAQDKLEEGEYTEAATLFDEVTRQHPYSKWAIKAQVMEAYAQYRGQKYDNVIASLEAFVGLHPAHPDVPYALYLTGLSYYEQIGPSKRDQQDTQDASRTFNELVSRFSGSPYAKDAKAKIILLRDAMAGKSMKIGHYYMEKKAYQAAITRFQEVIDRYQTTRHVEEALHRVVECYVAMGLTEPAVNTAAVLGHNFPGGSWYAASYELLNGDSNAKLNVQKPKVFEGEHGLESEKDEGFWSRLKNWNKGARKNSKMASENISEKASEK